jgi:Na+/phosphate symporter
MVTAARKAAIADFGFNFVGVLLFFPSLPAFSSFMIEANPNPALAVARAHLIFNAIVATLFMLFLPRIEALLTKRFTKDAEVVAMGQFQIPWQVTRHGAGHRNACGLRSAFRLPKIRLNP